MPLSQMILAYGEQVALATGSALCVMDRAVTSQAMAQGFDEAGLGVLCMLDDQEHHGLESFAATQVETLADGTQVSRARTEMQENACKRMMDHGALAINGGRKTILGPARHQQRQQDQLDASLESAQKRVDKKTEAVTAQQDKGAESEANGHGTRLEQRQGT